MVYNSIPSVSLYPQNVKPVGRPKVITDAYVKALKQLVKHSPQAYGYPFKRWTAAWLGCHLVKEFGIEVSDRHICRLLQQMGLSTRMRNAKKSSSESSAYQMGHILIEDLNPGAIPEFSWPQN